MEMNMTRYVAAALLCLVATPSVAAQRVWISEFAVLGTAQNGAPQIANLPSVADQTVIDTASGVVTSSPFNPRTQYIRVCVEAQSALKAGGTATTASMPLFAGQCEYFGVQPGATISVIANP
jgi:uncharacterized NAD-dependent epimerase/dehydratase family protein